ncbi:hypothetical protein Gogos_000020, partial [Gossypium gossypioides]|nr:hypothetical protein [Gossypium gossypioides]
FEWAPYEDSTIWAVILDDFFVNPNAWHIKVPLVVYATVEMHEANRVLRQFRFQQSISVLACYPDYMSWFRIHGKPYLLEEEARRRRPHMSRPRRAFLNPKGGEAGPSSVPAQEPAQELAPASSALPPSPYPLHYVSPYSGWTVGHPSAMWYTPEPSHFLMTVVPTAMYRSSMHEALMESTLAITSTYGTQHSYAHSLPEVARMQGSTSTESKSRQPQPHSEAKPGRNPTRNHRPPGCGTDSD